MKETLKQMQISKGGEPLPSSPSCSAQGQPADLLLLAEGAPAGERQGCWELLSPPGAGPREAPEEPEETGFTQRKQSPCSASPTGMQLTELGQRRASRPGRGQLGNVGLCHRAVLPARPVHLQSSAALTCLCAALVTGQLKERGHRHSAHGLLALWQSAWSFLARSRAREMETRSARGDCREAKMYHISMQLFMKMSIASPK